MTDQADFEALFAAEYPRVLRAVLLVTGDRSTAEDRTQDAFERLFVHWVKVRRYERPGAWVRRVAIRAALKQERRTRRANRLHGEAHWSEATPEVSIDVRAAIAALSGHQRAAIALRYFDDCDIVEIARILHCSESTARVHLHRGRKRLAELLAEEVATDVS